jgi:hypothetical protein
MGGSHLRKYLQKHLHKKTSCIAATCTIWERYVTKSNRLGTVRTMGRMGLSSMRMYKNCCGVKGLGQILLRQERDSPALSLFAAEQSTVAYSYLYVIQGRQKTANLVL